MNKAILSLICCLLLSNQALANELLVISGKNSKNSKKWYEEVYQKTIQSGGGPIVVKVVTIEADNFPKDNESKDYKKFWLSFRKQGAALFGLTNFLLENNVK